METEEILVAIQKAADTIATPNCAAWLSAVAALAAVAVAIIIAIKQNNIAKKQNEIAKMQADIAEQQNKIALFEKRYAVYSEISKIINFSEGLDPTSPMELDVFLFSWKSIWGIDFANGSDKEEKLLVMVQRLAESKYIIDQSVFLFPCVSRLDVYYLLTRTMDFMVSALDSNEGKVNWDNTESKNFMNTSKDFKKKYFEMMIKKLNLAGSI